MPSFLSAKISDRTFSVAATEIPDRELLWHSDDETQTVKSKNGILEQLGRMLVQDHFSEGDCVYIANLAVAALQNGNTSREIEKAIREIRLAMKRSEAEPDNKELLYLAQLGIHGIKPVIQKRPRLIAQAPLAQIFGQTRP